MKGSADLKEVITLISDNKITRFNEIFRHTTIKRVSDASKITYARMLKIVNDPGKWRFEEINLFSVALHILPLEILTLLKNELEFIQKNA